MNTLSHVSKISILAAAIALTACSDNKSKSSPSGLANNSAGEYIISTVGGSSVDYNGGNAGSIIIEKYYSPTALIVSKNGTPDTSYNLPQQAANFGTNSVTISSNKEIPLNNSTTGVSGLAVGDLYLADDDKLYSLSSESTYKEKKDEVTGLTIAKDVVVTLKATGNQTVEIFLANDLVNDGVIETEKSDTEGYRSGINITSAAYYGTGKITTTGLEKGQSAGDISLSAYTIKNEGEFNANGADSDLTSGFFNGGTSGDINLSAGAFIENKGALLSEGGDSVEGNAGRGAREILLASPRVYNSGAISANDGSGKNASNSATNNFIKLEASEQLINTGDISINGAHDTDASNNGNGGVAGKILFELEVGGQGAANADRRMINHANLTATGGETSAPSTSYRGGVGGQVVINTYDGYEEPGEGSVKNALVVISGDITLNGGRATADGAAGGDGGTLNVNHESRLDSQQITYLVGYSSIITSGGKGVDSGDAGDIEIGSYDGNSNGTLYPAGSVYLRTDVTANAGQVVEGSSASSGDGGDLTLENFSQLGYNVETPMDIEFIGNFNANASDVVEGDEGRAGNLEITGEDNVKVSAEINVNGSSVSDTDDDNFNYEGGEAGSVMFVARAGQLSADVQITSNGGQAESEGGDAGAVLMQAATSLSASGNISLVGGKAAAGTEADETTGGEGGHLVIRNANYNAKSNVSVNYANGTGFVDGTNGSYTLNADCEGYCVTTNP